MRNNWDLLTETRNNVKVLKIKKVDTEYEFDREVSKNANGEKIQKLKKIEMKKRGILAWIKVLRLK